jgi:hypothetical protein
MPDTYQTPYNPKKNQCDACPLKIGSIPVLEKGSEMTSKRINVLEQLYHDRMKECTPVINSKVGWKVFWPIIITFIGIISAIFTFTLNSQQTYQEDQKQYQRDHNVLHKEMTDEIRDNNRLLNDKVQQISEDVTVIKTKVNGGH